MSVAGKRRKHKEKMAKRKAEKAARKAQYAALRGTSRKAKRQTKGKRVSNTKHAHTMFNCGNPGCKKCRGIGIGRT